MEEDRDDGYKFRGTGDYNACQESLLPLLNLTTPCQTSPCSFNGMHQPEINFYNSEFYGFAEFWYTMEDVYRIGGQYEYDIFAAQAKVRCMIYRKAACNITSTQCFLQYTTILEW